MGLGRCQVRWDVAGERLASLLEEVIWLCFLWGLWGLWWLPLGLLR